MKYQYCNAELTDDAIFCDKCGQSINQEQKSSASENYWSIVANDDK